jgi:DNA (cytosine-5)-methyltransferase 1
MIQVIDFFCGCGGTSAGLEAAGMSILAGIDNDADAGATYQRNFPDAKFFLDDIRCLQPYDFRDLIGDDRSVPLLVSACAPCQPFSKQKTTKHKRDERSVLLDQLHRFVRAFRPEYLFLENVPGLQSLKASAGPLGRFIELLRSLGYDLDVKALESQKYGVPQVRRRLVLIASTLGDLRIPAATHGPDTDNPVYENVWDTISDLPRLEAGESHSKIANHQACKLSERNLRRISLTPEGGGRLTWPSELHLECHKGHTGHTDVYGRLHKHKPSAALSTRCISLSNGRYGHPVQNRAISAREAARIQTFDDAFVFEGSLTSTARQIGNAVPVRLATVFGDNFNKHFKASPLFQELE